MAKCNDCGEEADCFLSKCCGSCFEGVIIKGKYFIACEKCGKVLAELKRADWMSRVGK